MTKTGKDLRRDPRLSPILIRAHLDGPGQARDAYLTNISVGGAFLATEELPSRGEVLRISFYLPWGIGAVRTEARVVWRTDEVDGNRGRLTAGVGVAFAELSAAEKEKLHRYVEKFQALAAQIAEPARE